MIEIAIQAAREAGSYLKERFNEQLIPDQELHNDVKLPEDKESERLIIEVLHRNYPTHSIYSEEIGGVHREDEYLWIIDPLDGTNNYFIGYPYFSVSIALQHAGEIVLGVVYNPIADQMFWAEKGKGAYLNGNPLAVSSRDELKMAVGTYVRGRHSVTREGELAFTEPFMLETKRLMRNVGPALDWCLLARGWIDFVVMQKSGVMDVAAGILIAQEANALVTNWDGSLYKHQPFDETHLPSLLATNGVLHEKLRALIKE